MHPDLAITLHPDHPCREEERPLTSSRPATFDLAGRRASPSLAARLGRGVKMSRLRFYNQRSRHEHSISTSPLETATQTQRASPLRLCVGARGEGKPGGHPPPQTLTMQADPRAGEALPPHRSGIDAGPPRGHPASSGCALDGTPAGFGSIDAAWTLSRPCGRAPALFRLTGRLVDRSPLIPAAGERSWSR
jgi:hypothetical protein